MSVFFPKNILNHSSQSSEDFMEIYICLTSLTRAKCGARSTLYWKILNISTSTELFGFNFADNNLKLPNLSIHAFVIIQKSLEVH